MSFVCPHCAHTADDEAILAAAKEIKNRAASATREAALSARTTETRPFMLARGPFDMWRANAIVLAISVKSTGDGNLSIVGRLLRTTGRLDDDRTYLIPAIRYNRLSDDEAARVALRFKRLHWAKTYIRRQRISDPSFTKRDWQDARSEYATFLKSEGLSLREIGDRLGVSTTMIRYLIRAPDERSKGELSVRATNALLRLGVLSSDGRVVKDPSHLYESEILRLPNCGRITCKEIMGWIRARSWDLPKD